jgi:hypothetical protein
MYIIYIAMQKYNILIVPVGIGVFYGYLLIIRCDIKSGIVEMLKMVLISRIAINDLSLLLHLIRISFFD